MINLPNRLKEYYYMDRYVSTYIQTLIINK